MSSSLSAAGLPEESALGAGGVAGLGLRGVHGRTHLLGGPALRVLTLALMSSTDAPESALMASP